MHQLRADFPAAAREYHVIRVFQAPSSLNYDFLGLSYFTIDAEFFVVKYRPVR
jgi:hypothetical protein